MFDIGWTEILLLAVVAIIVVGPKDLPRMLRNLGRYAGQLKRTAGEFRSQFDDAIRESELDELRSSLKDVTDNPVNQIKDSMSDSMKPLEESASQIKSGIEKKDTGTEKPTGKTGDSGAAAKPSKTQASGEKPKPKSRVKPEPKADESAASAKSGG